MYGSRLLVSLAAAALLYPVSSGHASGGAVAGDCTFNGKPLYGRVQIVEHFPDIKIQVVQHFPDLNVKVVEHFPDSCGRWEFVEHFPDFKVQIVEHFPDVKVKYVEHFPGLP